MAAELDVDQALVEGLGDGAGSGGQVHVFAGGFESEGTDAGEDGGGTTGDGFRNVA